MVAKSPRGEAVSIAAGGAQSSRFGQVILQLARHAAWADCPLLDAIQRITEGASRALDIERVSVWAYEGRREALRCLDLYERRLATHSRDQVLSTEQYPVYFRALESERVIAAEHAQTDRRTREFAEDYLRPLGITSMLDSPFLAGGETSGVVCFEHVGSPRCFASDERQFAASVADLVSLAREVRERVRAQESQQQTERNLRQIIDLLPPMITVQDAAGRFRLVNQAAARVYGRSVDEMLGRTETELLGRGDRGPRWARSEAGRPAPTGSTTAEEVFVDAEGDERIFHTARLSIAVEDEVGTLGVATDVTRRKRDEAILAGFNRVLEYLASGVDLYEVLGMLATAAEAASPGALVSILLLDRATGQLRHGAAPSLPRRYTAAIDGVVVGRGVGSCGHAAYTGDETVVEDIHEHPYWASFREVARLAKVRACWSRPIASSSGEILGTFAVYYREPRAPTEVDRDFIRSCSHVAGIAIEHCEAQARLRESKSTLERRVRERTRDLSELNRRLRAEISQRERAQLQLQQLARSLEHSNAELEQFAYVASHDLQEPLRKIQAFGDLLQKTSADCLSEAATTYLGCILDASRRLRSLISDLLAFSRIGMAGMPLVDVDLGAVVRDVLGDLAPRVDEAHGEVQVGELPVLRGNETELRQLLQNLIGNALKYRRADVPARVRVEARRLDSTESVSDGSSGVTRGPFVEIRVRDNGIGFDERHRERIFAPFQRLHGRDEYEGTGMGLAVCRKIVERRGGTISAQSTPGVGSVFTVLLPQDPPEDSDGRPGS